jgi:cytochrome c oxidase subunit 2
MMQAVSTQVVNDLFWLFFWPAVAVAVLVFAWMGYAMVKFRAKPGQPEPKDAPVAGQIPPHRGSRKVEVTWTVIPTVIVLFLAAVSMGPLNFLWNPPPGEHLTIRVESYQWAWDFVYPEGFKTLNELRVPMGQPVVLDVRSRDVIHAFYVPDFALKTDAVPGQPTVMWFNATKTGTYRAQCAEYCGLAHARMLATVIVMEPAAFEQWRAERARGVA